MADKKAKLTQGARIRYNTAAKHASKRGEVLEPIEEWAPKNLKKDKKGGCFISALLGE